jgi:hypothetical protein
MKKALLFVLEVLTIVLLKTVSFVLGSYKVKDKKSIDVYCFACSKITDHVETKENRWACPECRGVTRLSSYSRYSQIFQETKIHLISLTHNPKVFTAYHYCTLEVVDNPDDLRPVWPSEKKLGIRVNINSAHALSNKELEKMFAAALSTVVAYRVRY